MLSWHKTIITHSLTPLWSHFYFNTFYLSVSPCNNNPCENNGTCSVDVNGNVTQMPKRIQYNTNIKPNMLLTCNGTTTDNNS